MDLLDLIRPNSAWRRWVQVVCFALIGLGGIAFGIWAAVTPQQLEWGTFTQVSQTCDRHDDCTAHGTWTSSDGTRHLTSVDLDGDPVGSGRSVKAAKDLHESQSIVHTSQGLSIRGWLGWAIGVLGLGASAAVWAWTRWRPQDTWLV